MTYNWINSIKTQHFEDKSVLLIGAGFMGENYALALSKLKIHDVSILSRSMDRVEKLCKIYGFHPFSEGYEKNLSSITKKDLVVVATPTELLVPATLAALKTGQTNILVEKPGSLYEKDLLSLNTKIRNQNVRVAYNRAFYPVFHKLKELTEKEGGITSCFYTFTEWIHKIDPKKFPINELNHWGISNSLHVISTAHELIGLPAEISTFRGTGKIDWHPTGSVFVGGGISTKKIPFSYHANWESAGRWGIDVMTKENAYRLMPMEELQVCKRGTVNWEKVPVEVAFPDAKMGIAEEIAAMLNDDKTVPSKPFSVDLARKYIILANQIFGYE